MDEPIKIIDSEGKTTHISYQDDYLNDLGQKVLRVIQTDVLGRKTISIYDALHRLRDIVKSDAFGVLLAKQHIDYDAIGRQTQTVEFVIKENKTDRLYTNTFSYHLSGQIERMVEAAGTPEEKVTQYVYNTYSQKERIIKPDGIEIYHACDPQGLLKKLSSSDKSISYSYEYDRNHRLICVIDHIQNKTTKRSYNLNGDLIQETLANGIELKYDYDRMSRLKKTWLPDNSQIEYVYHANNLKQIRRLKEERVVYTHLNYDYDQSGALLQSSLIGKAGKVRYSYDSMGKPKKTENCHRTQTADYDIMGRMQTMVIEDRIGVTPHTFEYDALDHLQKENDTLYLTDSIHNRLQKNKEVYHLNALNQLLERGNCQYAYDSNGNLIKKIEGDKITHYFYDALDRLVKVNTEGKGINYEYDSFNRRVAKTIDGQTIRFLYQGMNEIGSIDSDEKIQELRILGVGRKGEIGSAIALEIKGDIYAPLYDLQGHPTCLIDSATGLAAEFYHYTAFGEETIYDGQGEKISTSLAGNPWRFSCKRIDPETGWVYFGMRYYDPEIGRWTTSDPALFADGPNLYAYLHHQPLMAYDAYGLNLEDPTYENSVQISSFSDHSNVSEGPRINWADSNHHTNDSPEFVNWFNNELQESRALAESMGNAGSIFTFDRNKVGGTAHGGFDFCADTLFGLSTLCCIYGENLLEFSLEEREAITSCFFETQAEISTDLDAYICDRMESYFDVDTQGEGYQVYRQNTATGLEYASMLSGAAGIAKAGVGFAARKMANSTNKIAQKLLSKAGKAVRSEAKRVATQSQDVINVTPHGVALPNDPKYQIPLHYVENKNRSGSYDEYINEKFVEKLRIDPATLPGQKGPNYSHYHLNEKRTHYGPRPGMQDPGFNR